MADPVGLSIGTTNLVAARLGAQPVTRRSVLTIYGHSPPEIGLPAENPDLTDSGLVMRGFVERVGDPVPLVAADGSAYLADRLIVDALGAMADTLGVPSEVAVPAYWGTGTVRTLSDALSRDRKMAPTGVPPRLISDAVAALVALRCEPGLTSDGLVVLLDFGGSGTSITIVDAANSFEPITDTVRHPDFSGDQIDQAILSVVFARLAVPSDTDLAATAAVGSLTRLRDECQQAKERLSAETATTLSVDLPGAATEIRFTRTELENLIEASLEGVVTAVQNQLQQLGRTWSDVSTVATVGGGASIPLVTQRLLERTGAPVVTTAKPGHDSALGAALVAARGPDAEAATGVGSAVGDAATAGIGGARDNGAVGPALAWSVDDDSSPEPAPYTEANPYVTNPYASDRTSARPRVEYIAPSGSLRTPENTARRLPKYVVGAAALIALVAAGGVAYSLTSTTAPAVPTPGPTTQPVATPTEVPVMPPPTSEAPPPPPPPSPPPPVTTYAPAPAPRTVTETVEPTTTTVTVSPTTTTAPTTTTTPPETTPTTTPAITPTTPPVATTTPRMPTMTTTYITVPFVPVPIPIPVPQNPFQQPQMP